MQSSSLIEGVIFSFVYTAFMTYAALNVSFYNTVYNWLHGLWQNFFSGEEAVEYGSDEDLSSEGVEDSEPEEEADEDNCRVAA